MQELYDYLLKNPLLYVTRDIERAMGISPTTEGYVIIANESAYAKEVPHLKKQIHLSPVPPASPTSSLLTYMSLDDANKYTIPKHILSGKKKELVVFKQNALIHKICEKHNYKLLNPSYKKAEQVESKLSQIEWLGDLAKHLPPYEVVKGSDLPWDGTAYILQTNRSHSGEGTVRIEKPEQVSYYRSVFSNQPYRTSKLIDGHVYTMNVAVGKDTFLTGNISYQITGLEPFTDRPFATIGNDWSLPNRTLSSDVRDAIYDIANKAAEKMMKFKWKGLFGIDVIVENESNEVYLIEINARQPASTTFESQLQKEQRTSDKEVTMFEAHLAALVGLSLSGYATVKINAGAQIIMRNRGEVERLKGGIKRKPVNGISFLADESIETLTTKINAIDSVTSIPYEHNIWPGSDLLRTQTRGNLMKEPNVLNACASTISETIKKVTDLP